MIDGQQLKTFLFCPRKLFLDKRLGLASHRNEFELRMAVFNEALQYTNRFEEGIVKSISGPIVYARLREKYRSSHSRALQEAIINHKDELSTLGMSIIETSKLVWRDLSVPTDMKARNTYEFMTQNRLYGRELWWNLMPKISLNLDVKAPKLGLSMMIDRVDNYPHTAIPSLVERGNAPESGMWGSHRILIGAAMLVLAENSLIVQEGNVFYDFGRTERDLVMSPELDDSVRHAVRAATQVMELSELPVRVNNAKKCDHCPRKDACYDDAFLKEKLNSLQE